MDPKAAARQALRWVRYHPEDMLDAAKGLFGLRVTIPLDLLRWAVTQLPPKKAPEDVEIEAAPPGIRVGATLRVMKTRLRVGARIAIEAVTVSSEELRFAVRVQGVAIEVLGESDSPIAALIKSGSLDLSQPGKLVSFLPKRPPMIVEADGDRLVLDLMRDKKLAAKLSKVTSTVPKVVTVTRIDSGRDALHLQLSCFPEGVGSAVAAVRAAL